MDIQEFISIAVVGAFLSLIVEMVKDHKFNPLTTKAFTIGLAIITAGGYVWVRSTPYFETLITVLGTASIVYGFFLNKK